MSKVEIELEDVQLLWDNVISSMDWGSGFLDAEEMLRILVIGARFGFDISAQSSHFPSIVGDWERDNPKPSRVEYRTSSAGWSEYLADLKEWNARRTAYFESKLAEAVAKYDMTDPYNPPSE